MITNIKRFVASLLALRKDGSLRHVVPLDDGGMNLIIALAQMNLSIGDLDGNVTKMLSYATKARDELHADIIVFSELALTGYSPEDNLLRPGFLDDAEKALEKFTQSIEGIYCLVGHPHRKNGKLYNAASMIHNHKIIATYHKQKLPNHAVFDECRYFTPGDESCIVMIKNIPVGILICEDIWHGEPLQKIKAAGAQLLLSPNGSPFEINKDAVRQNILKNIGIPTVYVNQVEQQDELLFDGGSMVFNAQGECILHANFFEEQLLAIDMAKPTKQIFKMPTQEEKIYNALVFGLRDYLRKNNFNNVLLGLSGGIDSALVLALAVDALGKDHVEALILPTQHTAPLSFEIADELLKNFGVARHEISIEPHYQLFKESLNEKLTPLTDQNIQARCRAIILMARSNQSGALLLSTSNKSESAVGYTTLYGDMAGGFAPLKDVPKTMVYDLVRYRNTLSPQIPKAVIDRPPTAELAPGQKDQDNLPPYEILDAILEHYLMRMESISEIVAQGFQRPDVERVVALVKASEHKRHQAPPGVRLDHRAFGRDRRYPITCAYKG